nr:EAL domain-containing protein [Motiliproteus sediminis]
MLALASGFIFTYQQLADIREQSLRQSARDSAASFRLQLDSSLRRMMDSAALLANEPALTEAFPLSLSSNIGAVNEVLDRHCITLNASVCYLLGADGRTFASSNRDQTDSFVGKNYAFRPYFQQASDGLNALYLALGVTSGKRGIYVSAPVRNRVGAVEGVAVIKYSPQLLEKELAQVSGQVSLVSDSGVVFVSSRADWRLRPLQILDQQTAAELRRSRQFGELRDAVGLQEQAGGRVRDAAGSSYLIHHLELPLLPGWQLIYLADEREGVAGWVGSQLLFGLVVIFVAFTALVLYMYQRNDRARWQAEWARKAMEESEERFRRLSEVTSEAIFVHEGGQCLDANRTAEKLFGYTHDEFLVRHATDIIAPECHPLLMEKIRNRDEAPYEVDAVRKDGSRFPAEIQGNNLIWKGRAIRVTSVRDISARKAQDEAMLRQAHYDNLTALPNRVLCRERILHALERRQRNGSQLAVMLIDLDDFKKINDTLGHQTGDELLLQASQRLKACLLDGDTLSRHGGDEFVVLLEDLADGGQVERMAEKILAELSRPFVIDAMDLVVTASIGVVLAPRDGLDYPNLMRNADIAMYKAKSEGKNNFDFFTPEMNVEAHRHLELDRGLRQALANRELSLQYQPIWDVEGDRVLGSEALLRWHSPELGFVSPAEFIPLAENTGIIVEIGAWVLEQACAQMRCWLDQGCDIAAVSVNVSPRQLRQEDFVVLLAAALERHDLKPQHLVVEVTEGMLIQDDARITGAIDQLHRLGVCLAMDDFGTGYSSLSYLRRFPFTYLKIDRAFVNDSDSSSEAAELLKAIIAMAHGLGLNVVAEGVETEQQQALLQTLSCDRLQGYLLGRPMAAADLTALLNSLVISNR